MNAANSAIFVLALLGSLFAPGKAASPVVVTLYYESYCPFSRLYIANELLSAYNQIPDIMDLRWNPSNSWNQTTKMPKTTCQHGDNECAAQLIQACALKMYANNKYALNRFIFCMEIAKSTGVKENPLAHAQPCAGFFGLNYTKIKSCADSPTGAQYMAQYTTLAHSLNPPLPIYPWVTIGTPPNLLNDQATENEARNTPITIICRNYKGTKPAACYA